MVDLWREGFRLCARMCICHLECQGSSAAVKYFTTIIALAKSEPGRQERGTDMWGGGGQYLRMSGLKHGVGGFVFGLRGCGSMVSRGSQGEG